MAKTEAPLSAFQLVNQLEKEHWQGLYDMCAAEQDENIRNGLIKTLDNALVFAQNGNPLPLATIILQQLNHNGLVPLEIYAIIHNSDNREVWDEAHKTYVIEAKPTHLHLLTKLAPVNGSPNPKALLSFIAAACGVQPNEIEKPDRGRYAYDNMLAYLIHIKDTDKYQYDPTAVLTLSNENVTKKKVRNYMDIYAERHAVWERGRATKKKKKACESVDWLVEQILTGQVSRDQVVLTDDYYNVYAHNKRQCDDAFATYSERCIYKTLQALDNGELKVTVYFITGRTSAGKSKFARTFMGKLIERAREEFGEKWRICETAATNPVDDYAGEEILFMDDSRGNGMLANDWLKLLDPYNMTPSSARYRNKAVTARVIVITSEKDFYNFFYYTKGMTGAETMDQFIRRIEKYVQIIPADKFENNMFKICDSQKENHTKEMPVTSKYNDITLSKSLDLTYNFGNEKIMPLNEALDELVSTAIRNNSVKEVGAEI